MRIVWKDSNARERKPVQYRGYTAHGNEKGWEIDFPGDDNIYSSHYCALNAIDKHLGGEGIRGKGSKKRYEYGIHIIGKKNKSVYS